MLHLLLIAACGAAVAPQALSHADLAGGRLLDEIERRAVRFFWEQSDPKTGLTKDRAGNFAHDNYTVASTASTGYALAALPIAAQRGWIERADAEHRAEVTLRFVVNDMPRVHGWLYHFVDMHTGQRVWKCELSSVDTCLLLAGALACGQYFHGTEVQHLANALYNGLDWSWMLTNGGTHPDKRALSMGWKPESGFLSANWDGYCEDPLIYILGMGAAKAPLPAACWEAFTRRPYTYDGITTLVGGPIFMHEMPQGYYRLKGLRDRLGYDYWLSSRNAVEINRRYCMDLSRKRKTYGPDVWGLNASDGPKGYNAFGVPEPEDGTVSPTGALAAITFAPELALAAGHAMLTRYGARIWGRYGFSNAFNVDADWYDPDVIGIDLGMALLAIENHRTGLVWRLVESHPSTRRGIAAAGFHPAPRVSDPNAVRVTSAR